MSEARHTPGPWEWSEDSPDAVLRGGDRDVVSRPNYGTCVGAIYDIIMAKEEDKDLVAAAPDLLDVAEHFCYHRNTEILEGTCVFRCGRIKNGVCQQATDCWILKAIQKARGRV